MDKLNITRGCPGLSFLNTGEKPMTLINIVLSGLSLKSEVKTGDEFLMDEVIGGAVSMKLVMKSVDQYDTELPLAIVILKR